MRVPVLVVTPRQEPLTESAIARFERRAPTISLESASPGLPSRVEIDPSFAAVPLGTGRAAAGPLGTGALESAVTAAADPQTSETFVVRGFVESDGLEDIPSESDGNQIFADPRISYFLTCGGTAPVGNSHTVANRLNVAGLRGKQLDGSGVAVAILDTGINRAHLQAKLGVAPQLDVANSWMAPGNPNRPGSHPVNHGTMCAFDALIAAPQATLLDFPILSNPAPGGSIVGSTLSVALLGFSQLLAFWAVAFAPQGAPKYAALVCSNSWGIFHPSWDFPKGHPGRFIDNPNHPFHTIVSALARSGADIVFAAGNCGAQCADGRCQGRTKEAIMGASAHPDVLTLAGCDTHDLRVGYSSQGPSIGGMFQQKPDVSAYTHFLGSEAFGANSPDSGTSAACPVAAGCVAALRTKVSPARTSPAQMIATLRNTSRKPAGQTGWNGDYGFGIIDPVAAATSFGL